MNDDLHSFIEPALEARIVALILGEASAFEQEELERIIVERPEVGLWKRRMEEIHGLAEEAARAPAGKKWQLSDGRRVKVFSVFRKDEVVEVAPEEILEKRIKLSRKQAVYSLAACLGVSAIMGAMFMGLNSTASSSRIVAYSVESEVDLSGGSAYVLEAAPGEDRFAQVDTTSWESAPSSLKSESGKDGYAYWVADESSKGGGRGEKKSDVFPKTPATPVASVKTRNVRDGGLTKDLSKLSSTEDALAAIGASMIPPSEPESPSLGGARSTYWDNDEAAERHLALENEGDRGREESRLAAFVGGGVIGGAVVEDDPFAGTGESDYGGGWGASDPFADAPTGGQPGDAFGVSVNGVVNEGIRGKKDELGRVPVLENLPVIGSLFGMRSERDADLDGFGNGDLFSAAKEKEGEMAKRSKVKGKPRQIATQTKFVDEKGLDGRVAGIVTAGNRSGDFAMRLESIDGVLRGKGPMAAHLIGEGAGGELFDLADLNRDKGAVGYRWSERLGADTGLSLDDDDIVWSDEDDQRKGPSLFDLDGESSETELPLTWTAGASLGYDDNASGQDKISKKLNEIIIPELNIEGKTVSEAMSILSKAAAEHDGSELAGLGGFNFVARGATRRGTAESLEEEDDSSLFGDGEEATIDELNLRNVPLGIALQYVAEKARQRYRVTDDGVEVMPISAEGDSDMVTRTFDIPEGFEGFLESGGGGSEDDPFADDSEKNEAEASEISVKELLQQNGVTFSDGARANIIDGKLIVSNSATQNDLVDAILGASYIESSDGLSEDVFGEGNGGGGSLPAQELIRRQVAVSAADEALMEGRKKYAEGDYDGAVASYRKSLSELPYGTATEERRKVFQQHLQDGSVALSQKQRRVGKYDEARELLTEVIDADPDHAYAKKELEYLDDPIRTNPALTFDHTENVEKVRRSLSRGERAYDLGLYDKAEEHFHGVLRKDPYNKAARRWLERCASIKSDYYRAAYDEDRSRMLAEVDKAWEESIPPVEGKDSVVRRELPLNPQSVRAEARKLAEKVDESLSLGVVKEEQLSEEEKRNKELVEMQDLVNERQKALTVLIQDYGIPYFDGRSSSPVGLTEEKMYQGAQQRLEKLKGSRDELQGQIEKLVRSGTFDEPQADDDELKELLTTKMNLIDRQVESIESTVLSKKSVTVDLSMRQHDYNAAKDEYEQARDMLREMKHRLGVVSTPMTEAKLAQIVIPVLDFQDTTLEEALGFMSIRSKELDATSGESSNSDLEFVFEDQNLRDLKIDRLELENVPLKSAATSIANAIGARYRVEGKKVIFYKEDLREKVPDDLSKLETLTSQKTDSTFSLNVSDVSFKLAKAALSEGRWPEAAKVRPEEFVNALDFGDRKPSRAEKVACVIEQGSHPFMQQRSLMRVALSTAALGRNATTPLRLTILLDQSGSMERHDRAESVRRAFDLLAAQLTPADEVTLVGFARTPRILAQRVKGDKCGTLSQIVRNTPTEGGTNLEEALTTGLQIAQQQFVEGAQNRVILLTDGAANLGGALPATLANEVEKMRRAGVAFDACGVGADGYNDDILSALTKQGDGRYYFLDRPEDADEGFARQIAGALRPSAKNVKVQVIFNPERVERFRLYGFEKHRLKKEDFRNDSVDAAEMAAEESGVALYHYQAMPEGRGDVGTVSVRFQDVASGEMIERMWSIPYEPEMADFAQAKPSLRLAGVAGLFAERLKNSPMGARVDLPALRRSADGLRGEFGKQRRFEELRTMIQQAGE